MAIRSRSSAFQTSAFRTWPSRREANHRAAVYNFCMRSLVSLVCLAISLLAQQAPTGTIAGTLTDTQGRAVPGIPVEASNLATEAVYRATTSATGEYSIPQLPAGTYRLTVQPSVIAFQPFVRDNLQLAPRQSLKLDIRLEEGIALNTLGDGRDFGSAMAATRRAPPTGTAPHTPDGKPDLSGFWSGGGIFGVAGMQTPPDLEDWVLALAKDREANDFKDLPSAGCLPNGTVFSVSVGTSQKIVQTPGLLLILAEGQLPRQIFLDGRSHPSDPNPTWFGHSVGHWDGDTLVVDSAGFNDKTWLDHLGHSHTEMMHLVERYHRPDLGHLELELTVEDRGALKKPWILKRTYNLDPNEDIMESVCTENEKDAAHVFTK